MKIISLRWQPFRLPFARSFSTSQGAMAPREGLIIRLTSDDGTVGTGEATPLASFGGGTLADVMRLIQSSGAGLVSQLQGEINSGGDMSQLPSLTLVGGAALNFGLETALLDIFAQQSGLSLAQYLGTLPPFNSETLQGYVAVNATIGAKETSEAVRQVQAAVQKGFGTVKLKVGLESSIKAESERVAAVRQAIGTGTKLRLDANGAWNEVQAIQMLNVLQEFGLELVEQPVAGANLAGMARVRRAVSVPVAADEAATGIAEAIMVIEAEAADYLVIKPMLAGGLLASQQIIQKAAQAGIKTFVTTSIDAGIATAAALHLAATLDNNSLACGLATLPLLEASLIQEDLAITGGKMAVPTVPGLGVKLDEAQLAQYSIGNEQEVRL